MLYDIKSAVTRARAWVQMGKFDNAIVALADSLYVLGYYVNQRLPDEYKSEYPSEEKKRMTPESISRLRQDIDLFTEGDFQHRLQEALNELEKLQTRECYFFYREPPTPKPEDETLGKPCDP